MLMELATDRNKHSIKKINHICLPEKYSIETWENIIHSNCTVILKDISNSNKIVGYCAITDVFTKTPCIVSVAILPEYRNKGYGKNIIESAIKTARNKWKNCKLILHVRVSNIIAKNLYEKIGFIIDKKLEKYYDDEDRYEMYINI